MDSIYKQKYKSPVRSPVAIESINNFPTAAGLASSASGMAALTFGLYKLFELEDIISEQQLSVLSRQASGSSCRSIPSGGGFVEWYFPVESTLLEVGNKSSFAETIPMAQNLKDLAILIYTVSSSPKSISSSEGMRRTFNTSELFQHRIRHVVPERLGLVREAIASGSWSSLFKLIIMESNSLHACCLDSYPPILYLSEISYTIIKTVLLFNEKEIKAAYSFDAGPNAFIFIRSQDVSNWLEFSSTSIPNIPIIKSKLGFKGVHMITSK